MMKKFKLIKQYPGYTQLGIIVEKNSYSENYIWGVHLFRESDIENNPEFWEEIVEKEWEVLSIEYLNQIYFLNKFKKKYISIGGGVIKEKAVIWGNIYGKDEQGGKINIYSIKRLSDEIIFNINEIIVYNNINYTIKEFNLSKVNNGIYANLESITGYMNRITYGGLPLEKWTKESKPYDNGLTPQQIETINQMIDDKLKNYT